MERLNYQHLFYFWNVAREGGVTRASEKLGLAQPTISGQIAVLEASIGAQLFRKEGRNLVMTETGRTVFNYADEIFSLGRELGSALKNRAGAVSVRLSVGVSNALPKLLVYRLLEPALAAHNQVVCHEDKTERLLAELPVHGVDLVFSDWPATGAADSRIYNHPIGECGVAAFATLELQQRYRKNFPRCLDGAPLLLPTTNTALRRSLDQWLDANSLFPKIVAEVEDSALLKTFGAGAPASSWRRPPFAPRSRSNMASDISRRWTASANDLCDHRAEKNQARGKSQPSSRAPGTGWSNR